MIFIYFFLENKKSKVIYVRGLQNKIINMNILYNLFSNFGNILKIIFLRLKHVALIEFENVFYATQTKDFLNNIRFLNGKLKVNYFVIIFIII